MPGVDEEIALMSPTSPLESCLLEDNDRGNLKPNHSNSTQQTNHIPATRGSIRLSDSQNNNNKKEIPPTLLHPILHSVPMHVRFGLNGFLSNVLFSKLVIIVVTVVACYRFIDIIMSRNNILISKLVHNTSSGGI